MFYFTVPILTQGFATSGILTEIHQFGILVPALQSLIGYKHIFFKFYSPFFYHIRVDGLI